MATGGNFLSRRLEQLLPRVLEERFRELKFEDGRVCPVSFDLQAGATEVVSEMMTGLGDAAILAGDTMDFPIVDVSTDEERYRIVMIGAAFSYTFDQERKAEKGNLQITPKKMAKANRSIAERVNKFVAYGGNGLTGMVNNASVTLVNSTFALNGTATTALEIKDFWVDQVRAMYNSTNTIEFPSRALVDTETKFSLMQKLMPDSNEPVGKFIERLLSEDGYNFRFDYASELNSAKLEANGVQAGGTNKNRAVLYAIGPNNIERHAEAVQMMPSDWQYIQNGRKIFPMFTCTTPVMVNYPGAMRYIDTPKAA